MDPMFDKMYLATAELQSVVYRSAVAMIEARQKTWEAHPSRRLAEEHVALAAARRAFAHVEHAVFQWLAASRRIQDRR